VSDIPVSTRNSCSASDCRLHAQQQVGEIAAQIGVLRVKLQGSAELGNIRIARRQQFPGSLRGARLASPGRGQQGGISVRRSVQGFPDAAQIHQHRAAVRQQAPRLFIMLRRQFQLVALLGQSRQLKMRAEIVPAHLDGLCPAVDTCGKRPVYILESALRRGLRLRVAGLADAIEDAARLGLLLGLVAQEGVLQRHVEVLRVEQHGLPELVARRHVFADLQIGVGQVFANVGTPRRRLDGLQEKRDSVVILPIV
jgi:hypothetical protein